MGSGVSGERAPDRSQGDRSLLAAQSRRLPLPSTPQCGWPSPPLPPLHRRPLSVLASRWTATAEPAHRALHGRPRPHRHRGQCGARTRRRPLLPLGSPGGSRGYRPLLGVGQRLVAVRQCHGVSSDRRVRVTPAMRSAAHRTPTPRPSGWLRAYCSDAAHHRITRSGRGTPIRSRSGLRTNCERRRGILLPDLLTTSPPGGSRMGTAMSVTATAAPQRHNPVERYRSRGRGIRGPARRPNAGKASHHG